MLLDEVSPEDKVIKRIKSDIELLLYNNRGIPISTTERMNKERLTNDDQSESDNESDNGSDNETETKGKKKYIKVSKNKSNDSTITNKDDKVNVSKTGMKMVNSDKELKFLLKKYGFGTNLDSLPDELFRQLTDPKSDDYSGLRTYSKELTGVRKGLYQDGRLGMIIDGTGDDYKKIAKEKKELEKLGYDCYMIFVNTTLEVALNRNERRDRVLPERIVKQSHASVQKNIGGFQGLFGGSNFLIIDNNKDIDEEKAKKRFNMLAKQGVNKFVKEPIKKPIAKSWIRKQKMLRGENLESYSLDNGKVILLERVNFNRIAKEIMKKYRVSSKLEFSTRATKGDYDFEKDIIKLRPNYSSMRDFLITLLHEIYHAKDSKKYGKKEFVKLYQRAGDIVANQGKDFHDDNPYEIAAERWARREVNKYIRKYNKKNN